MNGAHLHLIVNHFSVVGLLIATLLLTCLLLFREQRGLFWASLIVIAFSGAGAFAAYFSGEPAEEVVEHLSGVDESRIERHEDAAKLATVLAGALVLVGAVAAGAVVRRDGEIRRVPIVALLASTICVLAVMSWVCNTGGEIRHSEIRTATAAK